MILKLDAALNQAENAGETDLERVAAPILRGHLRSAPIAQQNRKHDSATYRKTIIKPNPNQDATKSTKAA